MRNFFRRGKTAPAQSEAPRQPFAGEPEASATEPYVRVRVRLEQHDGWPPAESEGLWAQERPGGTYLLANTPFFAFGLSSGDLVRAAPDDDGVIWFTQRVQRGGNLTVRIITTDPADPNQDVVAEFEPLGVSGESMERPRLLALDLPPGSDLTSAKTLLAAGVTSGRWHIEESDISEEWAAL
ncbi:DUF4265 domain-containing protein [Frigoribacterium salinisoli]